MEITDTPLWHWIVSFWVSTWVLAIFRTWTRVSWALQAKDPKHKMLEQPVLHWIVYCICINFVLPVVGIPLVFLDSYRDKWVTAYVNALRNSE